MSLNRAYTLLTWKSIDDEKRIVEGIATTPTPDRIGDIVEPEGAEFQLPIPLLWQHMSSAPIGHVIEANVTPKGIKVKAQIMKVEEPGKLKDRLDEAWQSIKYGLVRGLSIGFKGIEVARIKDTYADHFLKWLWLELSAVTIPANGEATITAVKSIDTAIRAALGNEDSGNIPGVAGKSKGHIVVNVNNSKRSENEMNIADQIKSFEATRVQKNDRRVAIMSAAAEKGETLGEKESEEYDLLGGEIATIDKHLERLKDLEKAQAKTTKPVEVVGSGGGSTEQGSNNRDPNHRIIVRGVEAKVEPGIRFARYARVIGLAKKLQLNAVDVAKQWYGERDPIIVNLVESVSKAAVAAASTSNATWAGALVGDETSVFADFVEFLRKQTILGKFGTNGIPSLRRVPFRVPLIGQTSGGAGYWVGEGKPKPVTKFDFTRTTLEPLKVANIAVSTMETLRDSSPSAEGIIRDQLAAALRERLDIDFVDPTKAASAGVSPASITNGLTPITSSGDTADDVRTDIKALFAAFIADNNAPTNGVWIMPATTALALSLMQNPLGQAEFPGISMEGGRLFGLPVIVSEHVPQMSGGAIVILMNASDVYLSDEGGIEIDMSQEASLQMDNAPTNDSVTPTATSLVSLWQTNSVGFRAERTINWSKRRAEAVQMLSSVNWGD